MGTPVNPPDSPPKPPVIPEGLATKLGKYGAVLAIVLGVLAEVFDVEINTESIAAFGGSIVLLVTTMVGRYAQAAALYRDSPRDFLGTLLDMADEFEDTIEPDDPAPTEADLKTVYEGDPPPTHSNDPIPPAGSGG